MFRAMRMYNPHLGGWGYTIEKVLGIIGIVCFALGVFLWNFRDLPELFFAFGIAAWYYPFMSLIFIKWPAGYMLKKDRIVFHCKFKKNELLYEDIKCIIIVNTVVKLRITKTAWICMIGEQQDEILRYLINEKKRHVLTCDDITCKLGVKIGCFQLENVWKLFKKGYSTIYNYGFWWNKQEIHKVFEGYRGDYYIAASVISNYGDELNAICNRYGIESQRIHTIDDSINGEFIWN